MSSYHHPNNFNSLEKSQKLISGLDYQSFFEATTELFAVLSHSDMIDTSHMGEDVARRLNETLGTYRQRLIVDSAMLMKNDERIHERNRSPPSMVDIANVKRKLRAAGKMKIITFCFFEK